MDVLVVGGTGAAGRAASEVLVERGYRVRVLSRAGGTDVPGATGYRGDLLTGAGLAEALAGVHTVVDTSNASGTSQEKLKRFFVDGTRRLLEAEAAAGVKHHVLLSIVGIDGVPYAYYRAKVDQEKVVTEGPVPATILRATQFHDFAGQIAARTRFGPFVLVPTMSTRPVAVAEVATALTDAVERGAPGRAPDLRGPREEQLVDLVRRQLRARGDRAIVVPLHVPGKAGKSMRSGDLGGTGGVLGHQSFDDWLAATVPSRRR